MIPQGIKLSGFLSYKDEQEVRFDDSPLWMLTGTNGSGKSSIFDAVTFALFGHHRGGSQSAVELINKESNTLSVEFDFTVDKQLFRIKRTVRRRASGVASTQQVMRRGKPGSLWSETTSPNDSNDEGNQNGRISTDETSKDEWEAIPDTTYKTKFDAWIKDKIGLDYETFTSSVLLLQGKSEKLLDSTPAGRAGVLARIVDLERYQKLHAKSDDKRRELKGQLEGINSQLLGIREVTEEELSDANNRIEGVQRTAKAIEERIQNLVSLELQSLRCMDACTRLSATKEKLTNAEGLLGHAVAIEKEFARLRELRDVLPAVGTIVTERGRIGESERKSDKLTRQREDKADRRRQCEHALEQARMKLISLKKTLGEDEAKAAKLNARLRELSAVLEKVKQAEDAEAEVRRLEEELKRLPSDPDASVRKHQQEHDRLLLLSQHVALLERLHQEHSELTKAVTSQKAANASEVKLLLEGKKAKEEFDVLQERLKIVKEAYGKAEVAAAESRALAKQARDLADEFKQLNGAKTCRACGQPLTPEHFDSEKKKRDLDARSAERKYETLNSAVSAARQTEAEAVAKEAAERERLEKLRDSYKEAANAAKQSTQDIKRLTDSCRQTYFALPDEFKKKLGATEPDDWSQVTYPDRADLTELSTQVHGLDGVKRKLKQAQEDARKVQTLRAKLESARDGLQKAQQSLSSSDPAAIRQEFAARQSEEITVANSIRAAKQEIDATDKEITRLQRELSGTDQELTKLSGELNLEASTRNHSFEAIDRAKKVLPEAWQRPAETAGLKEHLMWNEEFESLTAKGIETKYAQLQTARSGLDSIRAEIEQHEKEVASYSPEARRSPDDVKAEIVAARKELELRNKELLDAQRQKGTLDDYRRQREELNARYKTVDAEHNRYKILSELLGRDRLQRFLVRNAEKQIVDYANSVLDRLSGGQLFLRLVATDDGSTEKALEMECSNRVTGGSAINVAFLSGSQRFRVAVALALGIGQYASKQHRPIESVIIDEGFGCLDRTGRQVMIQELQNLRGHLNCILLVSHQEEFADAFPDGYRFELQDGTTKVKRFVR
jgi:DNA repair exonuclease SbcCD ATPase subunit